MNDFGDLQWDDDLLSGYLDGELTEQQKRLVRERLASDPRAVELLKQLQRQREETLRSAGAIPVPDLAQRIHQRLAVEMPAAIPSTKDTSRPKSSRGAWRFAAALLAASLAGILIGPWFLRSRTEVSLQSPAPAWIEIGPQRRLCRRQDDERCGTSERFFRRCGFESPRSTRRKCGH
jgi:anti-sigma factor RsiW